MSFFSSLPPIPGITAPHPAIMFSWSPLQGCNFTRIQEKDWKFERLLKVFVGVWNCCVLFAFLSLLCRIEGTFAAERKKGCTGSGWDGDDPSRCSLTLIHHFAHMALMGLGCFPSFFTNFGPGAHFCGANLGFSKHTWCVSVPDTPGPAQVWGLSLKPRAGKDR